VINRGQTALIHSTASEATMSAPVTPGKRRTKRVKGRGPEFGDVWEIEDEQLIPVAKDLLAALEARAAQTSAAG
jgi:hypothetical protein